MAWLQVFLIFVGIPTALFVLISFVVMKLITSRVPDGIAAMQASAGSGSDEEGAEGPPQRASNEPTTTGSARHARPPKPGDDTTSR